MPVQPLKAGHDSQEDEDVVNHVMHDIGQLGPQASVTASLLR